MPPLITPADRIVLAGHRQPLLAQPARWPRRGSLVRQTPTHGGGARLGTGSRPSPTIRTAPEIQRMKGLASC